MTKSLKRNPKVRTMKNLLKLRNMQEMIGYLFDLWSWADDFSETGELFGISEQDLDDEIGLPGFADALRKVGWLEGRNASLSLPNYAEHNGQSAKRRCQESKRISELRKSNSSDAEKCTHAMRTKSVPEKRREENIGINKVESHSTVVNGNESSTKGSLQSSQFPKSVDEVKAILQAEVDRCLLLLMPDDLHDCAYQYFNAMEGCGWLDSRGRMVTKWQSHAKTYAAKWAKNINTYSKDETKAGISLESMPCLNENNQLNQPN